MRNKNENLDNKSSKQKEDDNKQNITQLDVHKDEKDDDESATLVSCSDPEKDDDLIVSDSKKGQSSEPLEFDKCDDVSDLTDTVLGRVEVTKYISATEIYTYIRLDENKRKHFTEYNLSSVIKAIKKNAAVKNSIIKKIEITDTKNKDLEKEEKNKLVEDKLKEIIKEIKDEANAGILGQYKNKKFNIELSEEYLRNVKKIAGKIFIKHEITATRMKGIIDEYIRASKEKLSNIEFRNSYGLYFAENQPLIRGFLIEHIESLRENFRDCKLKDNTFTKFIKYTDFAFGKVFMLHEPCSEITKITKKLMSKIIPILETMFYNLIKVVSDKVSLDSIAIDKKKIEEYKKFNFSFYSFEELSKLVESIKTNQLDDSTISVEHAKNEADEGLVEKSGHSELNNQVTTSSSSHKKSNIPNTALPKTSKQSNANFSSTNLKRKFDGLEEMSNKGPRIENNKNDAFNNDFVKKTTEKVKKEISKIIAELGKKSSITIEKFELFDKFADLVQEKAEELNSSISEYGKKINKFNSFLDEELEKFVESLGGIEIVYSDEGRIVGYKSTQQSSSSSGQNKLQGDDVDKTLNTEKKIIEKVEESEDELVSPELKYLELAEEADKVIERRDVYKVTKELLDCNKKQASVKKIDWEIVSKEKPSESFLEKAVEFTGSSTNMADKVANIQVSESFSWFEFIVELAKNIDLAEYIKNSAYSAFFSYGSGRENLGGFVNPAINVDDLGA